MAILPRIMAVKMLMRIHVPAQRRVPNPSILAPYPEMKKIAMEEKMHTTIAKRNFNLLLVVAFFSEEEILNNTKGKKLARRMLTIAAGDCRVSKVNRCERLVIRKMGKLMKVAKIQSKIERLLSIQDLSSTFNRNAGKIRCIAPLYSATTSKAPHCGHV